MTKKQLHKELAASEQRTENMRERYRKELEDRKLVETQYHNLQEKVVIAKNIAAPLVHFAVSLKNGECYVCEAHMFKKCRGFYLFQKYREEGIEIMMRVDLSQVMVIKETISDESRKN